MNPLAKEIIDKLNKEEDSKILAEVLDFYDYLNYKKVKEIGEKWANIEEDEPLGDEIKILHHCKESKEEFITLESLLEELHLDEK